MDPLVDLTDVQRLIAIVQRHGLDGLSVAEGEVEVHIKASAPPAEATAAAPAVATAVVDAPAEGVYQLKSPITGVFYRSPAPNEPEFVHEGDVVDENDPVCLIEAMKIFNEINAGVRGRLLRVVAANEQLVVSGEVLMEFEPAE